MSRKEILRILRAEMGVKRLRYAITQEGETVIQGTGNRQRNKDIDFALRQKLHQRVVFAGYSLDDNLDYFAI